MDGLLFAVTLAAGLGCGLVAGVFFAFSSFVMQGLERLEADRGIAAMQAINVTAIGPAFMLALTRALRRLPRDIHPRPKRRR